MFIYKYLIKYYKRIFYIIINKFTLNINNLLKLYYIINPFIDRCLLISIIIIVKIIIKYKINKLKMRF